MPRGYPAVPKTLEQRIWPKICVRGPDECWPWLGAKTGAGYGQIRIKDFATGKITAVYGHRAAYELTLGPIPDGLFIDHLCRNRECCNPKHMELITNGENVMRGEGACAKNARKTHCKREHEYTEENTYHPPSAPNQRGCKICRSMTKAQKREWDENHKTCG